MTVLGEAFIEVRADLRPFHRDLEKEVERAAKDMEKRLKLAVSDGLKDLDAIGEKAGDDLGDGMSRRIKRKMGDKKSSPWVSITAAFASALDDGISALPTEVKAGIVLGIIAALPFISGALAGAITAGLGAGLAGIGTFIAFQFDEVRERGSDVANRLRLLFIDAAMPFAPAVLHALDVVEDRFESWLPLLSRIFSKAASFVEPLNQGLLNMLQEILEGIDASLGDTEGFVIELGHGLRILGVAIGETLEILASTGDEGREAFRDFIFLLGNLLINLAKVIKGLTEIYGLVRDIAQAMPLLSGLFGSLTIAADNAARANGILVKRNHELTESTTGIVRLTDEETRKLKELEKNLKNASKATYDLVQSQIDFERALDDVETSLEANGKTLDITTQKGQDNAQAILNALKEADDITTARVVKGELNAQEAVGFYNKEIEAVQKLAREGGITEAQFQSLFGEIIKINQLRLDAAAMGITNTTDELADGVTEAKRLYDQLKRIKDFRLPDKGTRPFSEYAEGGIVQQPTQALIGEAGPEVVIPLTKPNRAAQLMQQSGLAGMLSAAASIVNVFIGNEQLDARMVRVAEANNQALSNSLAFGARGL